MTTAEAALLVTNVRMAGRLGSAGARSGSSATLAIAISIVACFLVVAFAITMLVIGFSNGRENDDGHDDGGPGGGGRPKPPDVGPSSDSDPAWWPEFEREFAMFVWRNRVERRRHGKVRA